MSQSDSTLPTPNSLTNRRTVPDPPSDAPYVPSDVEKANYYYGLPSKPRLIARSSSNVWMKPTGPEAYLVPKELTPLGPHRLNAVWEQTVGPAMDRYPGERGSVHHSVVEIAAHCRSILLKNGVDDVHIENRESKFTRAAALYKPGISSNPATVLREPFSTSLGLPICSANTTDFGGTGGFFFTDSVRPGILFLLTAKHVLFHPDREKNKLYEFKDGTGARRRDVLFLGEAAFKARVEAVEVAIGTKNLIIEQLCKRWALIEEMEDEDDATTVRNAVQHGLDETIKAIKAFEKLHADVNRDWQDEENRDIGHVVLSPPISVNYGDDGFSDDWAVVQIHPTKISKLNFIGNAIDLGSVEVAKLTAWMDPHPANPNSFDYPGDDLLRCSGTLSDQEMFGPDSRNEDHDNDWVNMVLKNGNASNLTVGRLNSIRSFVREYFDGKAGEMSKEMSVLPRSWRSGPFSEHGDSGSVVVDAVGRICGILIGGDGSADVSDCAFVTSINFLVKRLADFGIKPNIFPLPADL